jgi:hypothetical protein
MLVYKVADLAIKHDVNSSADMTNEGAPYEERPHPISFGLKIQNQIIVFGIHLRSLCDPS